MGPTLMVEFLSDEWLDEYTAVAASRPQGVGPDGTPAEGVVRITIEKAPRRKKVIWTETVVGGRVSAIAPAGAKDPADVDLIAPYPLAVELWRDGLDPAVAFMQGRLKMRGDSALWMRLLPSLRAAEYGHAVAALAARTDFSEP